MEQPISKAHLVTIEVPTSNKEPSELDKVFNQCGALVPPYNPIALCRIFERSSILRPNVDAYEVNIERSGWRFDETVKLDNADTMDVVRRLMVQEAMAEGDTIIPEDADVRARIIQMKHAQELELNQLNSFFRNCTALGFAELRARTRQDLEASGNGYWEVIRDDAGEPAFFEHLDTCTMRLMPLERKMIEVEIPYWISECSFVKAKTKRRFRRFVQLVMGIEKVYFKELGDPRIVSSKTNKHYNSSAEFEQAEPGVAAATEVLHWTIYCAGSAPYGVPRWIGATPAITGARGSEEINARYFDDKGMPNGILSVAGGEFGPEGVERIQEFFRENVQGRENFHKVLVLEVPAAVTGLGQPSTVPRIQFDGLAGALQKDGLFQDYEKNSERKVGAQFRTPGLFRGDSAELNKATADTAVELTNAQVFAPERQRFDDVANIRILPLLGIRYWKFVSGPVAKQDPKELGEMTCDFVDSGILVINEARQFASECLGKDFPEINEEWAKKPMPLLIKQQSPGAGDAVKELVAMRAALSAETTSAYQQSDDAARAALVSDDETDLDPFAPPSSEEPAPPGIQ